MELQKVPDGPQQSPTTSWSSARLSQHFIADYKPDVFVDGPGVRCSLYVSGCPFKCVGCYNEAAQSFRYGTEYTSELEQQILQDLSKSYIAGLTLLGGEPFLNTGVCLPLARRVKAELPDKTIWAWSGYTWEQLLFFAERGHQDQLELLKICDVLVDGPFIQSQFNSQLAFRSSENQRIIDVRASLKQGSPVVLNLD